MKLAKNKQLKTKRVSTRLENFVDSSLRSNMYVYIVLLKAKVIRTAVTWENEEHFSEDVGVFIEKASQIVHEYVRDGRQVASVYEVAAVRWVRVMLQVRFNLRHNEKNLSNIVINKFYSLWGRDPW